MTFHEMTSLEQLADEVLAEQALRLNRCDTIPMVPRSWQPRPRPKTAVIAQAAKRCIAARRNAEATASTLNDWLLGRTKL